MAGLVERQVREVNRAGGQIGKSETVFQVIEYDEQLASLVSHDKRFVSQNQAFCMEKMHKSQ